MRQQNKVITGILSQNQALVNMILSGNLPTFVAMQHHTGLSRETKEEPVRQSVSDEDERRRFDEAWKNQGLGEPIYPEDEVDGLPVTMAELTEPR